MSTPEEFSARLGSPATSQPVAGQLARDALDDMAGAGYK
jgi:hypothetical protein